MLVENIMNAHTNLLHAITSPSIIFDASAKQKKRPAAGSSGGQVLAQSMVKILILPLMHTRPDPVLLMR